MVQMIKAKFRKFKSKALSLYRKYERFFPVFFFVAGFLYDSLTLTRIDQLLDNLILLAYLILAGGLILLIGLIDTGQIASPKILRFSKWYPYTQTKF